MSLSLPDLIRQSMPLRVGNEKLCNRTRVGMDAMVKPWHDQCGLGFQGDPHFSLRHCMARPCNPCHCLSPTIDAALIKCFTATCPRRRPHTEKLEIPFRRTGSRFMERAAHPPHLGKRSLSNGKTQEPPQAPSRTRTRSKSASSKTRPPCPTARNPRTGTTPPVARHRS